MHHIALAKGTTSGPLDPEFAGDTDPGNKLVEHLANRDTESGAHRAQGGGTQHPGPRKDAAGFKHAGKTDEHRAEQRSTDNCLLPPATENKPKQDH
ncbi:hypothetical protein [Paeniglutamicibacter sp. NPDC091659]|uniref:hypothetical protein n=1 Tax=Paeniglutamicibacter sp. NPDC091659 TaxID=3364389 RepID=UPI003816A75B